MASPDIHLVGKPNIGAESLHDAQYVPADIIHVIGPEALIDDLADVEILTLAAESQKGRILQRNVLSVRAVQRLDLPPQAAVQLEPDKDWISFRKLHNQPFAR